MTGRRVPRIVAPMLLVASLELGCASPAPPPSPRYTLTRLADGTVLLTGDYDYESDATTELYEPGGGS